MERTTTLPQPVLSVIGAAFPGAPLSGLAPTVGGFSNLSVAARLGAMAVVVKASDLPAKGADLRREALVLDLIRGHGFGAPEALAFGEAEGWSVLVTRWLPGVPGFSLYGGPAAELAPVCAALGRALARLHAAPMPRPTAASELDLAGRASALAAALERLALPHDLRASLVAALGHRAWHTPRPQFVHGDAGLHNLLWDDGKLSLLDWELAGWGDPRLDLAWAAWTMRFRGLPAVLWEQLLEGYESAGGAGHELDDETLRCLALGQVAALLVRASGRPWAWDEWLRRARATVELKRIAPA